MKILLTGARGQVGTELVQQISADPDAQVVATDLAELDICNSQQIAEALNSKRPDVVVNAAAYTAVDAAETDIASAFAINAVGPELLARACNMAECRFVHLSTDFVFDGNQTEPYSENTAASPLSVYGKSKAAGEAAVREYCAAHIILRTAWVYSPWGKNFMKSMLTMMATEQPLRIVGDQLGSPTAASDVAKTIVNICQQITASDNAAFGTYHYCGQGVTSWYGFAAQIAAVREALTGQRAALTKISTSEYPTPARRPANSALNCDRIQEIFGITTVNWQQAVDREVRRYWEMAATGNSQ